MPAIRFLVPSITFSVMLLAKMTAGSAAAATCANQPVSARGDASRYETLAKAKARGNWRAKVRAMPTLGAAYADWYKALAADYNCSTSDGLHTCTAVAHPCRD
jgi:hypothetical protein